MGKPGVNIQEVAKTAALEALRIHKDEERERVRKTRFHNTELLLKNYMSLLEHYESSKDKASDIMDLEDLDDLGVDDVIIQAIRRSRIRTVVMINQIEICMEILRLRMRSKNQEEKYEVIYRLYLDKARRDIERTEMIKTISQELNCGEKSVYRWKNEMVLELSVLLFGVDGLKLDI